MAKNVQNSHFSFARIFIFNGKYAVTKFATDEKRRNVGRKFWEPTKTQKLIKIGV